MRSRVSVTSANKIYRIIIFCRESLLSKRHSKSLIATGLSAFVFIWKRRTASLAEVVAYLEAVRYRLCRYFLFLCACLRVLL